MPRRDGTGPMGIGPITGRGAGNCIRVASPEFANRGVGFGRGMGVGRGRMFCYTGMPGWAIKGYTPVMPIGQAMDEMTILKNQEDLLEKQLTQVKERLKDFDEQK